MAIQQIENKIFGLQTQNTTYVLAISEEGIVENLYWGNKIEKLEDFVGDTAADHTALLNGPQVYREECSSFGGLHFHETSLKALFFDGTRDFRYCVSDIIIENDHLEIVLKDIFYSFLVHLHYQVFEEDDIIKRWRVAENYGEKPVILERFYSAEYGLPGNGYQAWNFNSRWAAEFQGCSEPVNSGKKIYESFYGYTGHNAGPFFLVHKNADERSGNVYYGALEYSGNFKSVIEAVNANYLNILIGISDTDFQWTLNKGETFETPSVYSGYSDKGFEKMSHTLHHFCKNNVMAKNMANKTLPVLYNSWYATLFDVKVEEQKELAVKAAELGTELFVVDDGWFQGRTDDTAGLGDWSVDFRKFPQGLSELIEKVNSLGMKFGLWIEPEMVNKKSMLYKRHPDWILRYENREVLEGRNQYELDMSNPEVTAYLLSVLDDLLTGNKISYVKWDLNRNVSEMGSQRRNPSQWKEMWFRNVQGFYGVIQKLRERHPDVEFEACAGGGGRVDYGTMRYFHEYWTSDNTDPLDRLFIQENYSYFYPIKYMRSWFTEDYEMSHRKIPISFAMHMAMCGSLGIGVNLNHFSAEERKLIGEYVTEYKEIREIIQFGDVYRLQSLSKGDIQAIQYVYGKESVLFVFLDHERYGNKYHSIVLHGLKENKQYECVVGNRKWIKSGSYLMNMGIYLELKGDYDSLLLKIHEVK